MFEPDNFDTGWATELSRLGLTAVIDPLSIWLSLFKPLAWLLVCSRCDPFIELEQTLSNCEALDIDDLCQLVAGLEIFNWRVRSTESDWDPIISNETFEEFVFSASMAIRDPLLPDERTEIYQRVRDAIVL